MHRFFIEKLKEREKLLWLSPEESRHAVKVLRLKPPDPIFSFDSEGHEYEARIHHVDSKGRVEIEILKERTKAPENVALHVAQGFLQKQKMDWIVEKACELGVTSLIPIQSEFSMVHPKKEIFQKIKARWERIAREAGKQSGNIQKLHLSESLDFPEVLKRAEGSDLKFLFHPYGAPINLGQALEKVRKHPKPLSVFLMIGPEGGFSEREVKLAQESGIQSVRLDQNILRAETAFVVLTGAFRFLS